MSDKLEKIISDLSALSVKEAADLVKKLEEFWGVSAAPIAVAAIGPVDSGVEEKDFFNVNLKSAGAKKIDVIKVVRSVTSLGLVEAKALVDSCGTIKENISKAEAEDLLNKLKEAGAEAVMV